MLSQRDREGESPARSQTPHLFDDQLGHLKEAANEIPSVHVLSGVVNEAGVPQVGR